MEETLYARLIVGCGWEGETWAFYFQVTRDQFDQLDAVIEGASEELEDIDNENSFTLQEMNMPLEAVLFLIQHAEIDATGYTSQHSFIGRLTGVPSNIDDLYKTGICEFAEILDVEIPEEPTVTLEFPGLQHYIDNKVRGIAVKEKTE